MAKRNATLIIKNNANSSAPFSGASLYAGEGIVNTAAGIMMFSGVTTGTNDWVPAGINGNANFFEVGSNLYNLKIRNQISSYSGLTNLSGKFLSGTTNGFVLANISAITGVDTYVTGGTYNNPTGTATYTNNLGGQFIVSGFFTGGTAPTDVYTTGVTFVNNILTLIDSVGGILTTTINNFSGLTVTGSVVANTISATTYQNLPTDIYVTGGTFNAGTTTFTNNTGGTFNISGYNSGDTFTTGFTYSPTQNKLTISRNQGQPDLNVFVTSVSGLTVSDLTTDRLVYTTTSGKLITGTAIFDGTNMSLPSAGSLSVGTGGLSVTGDAIIQGSLTVFGPAISAFTSQLYVEDNNLILNYNPTGSTIATSIGAGWTIQDGNGVSGGSVNMDIRAMNTLTGLTASQVPNITEYTGPTGFENRGWVTQLNDIVIRSTNIATPNGVRVLTEFDILDGGVY